MQICNGSITMNNDRQL